VSRRGLALAALASVVALLAPGAAAAHGIGGIRDLPVPGWLFLVAGATVLVVSFVALGALWRTPKLREGHGWPLPVGFQRAVLSPWTRRVVQTLALVLFVLVWSAAAFGANLGTDNIAPVFVYVTFWVGVTFASAVLGDVWSALNPWRAAADCIAWTARRAGWARQPRPYPETLCVWPGALLLAAFIVLELVWENRAEPRTMAWAILAYSVCNWTGMLAYGRREWIENGDGFAVYFGFLARLGLFATREGAGGRELYVRQPLSGLVRVERRPGAVALLAVMLGSVAFDGLSRSNWWLSRIYNVETRFNDPAKAKWAVELFNFLGLVLVILVAAAAYLFAVKLAEHAAGGRIDFHGVFLLSLVPIAAVYVFSHYFTYLLIQGQFLIPRLSDPYGRGWDLFGSADFQPNLTLLTPNLTWYVQVSVLVAGHVLALMVAHDRAIDLCPSPRVALRTQYAMLGLMVLYTVGGMWLLSLG